MKKNALFVLFIFCAFLGSYFLFFDRPYLTVIGPIKMQDGIGRQAAELMQTFCDEVKIGYIPTCCVCLDDIPLKIEKLLKPNRKLGKIVIYESSLPIPNEKFYRHLNKTLKGPRKNNQIRIAYSMYEYSCIPDFWVDGLNTYFDAVAVPDPFLVEVYQKSGVNIPVFVLPLGLDMDAFLNEPLKKSAHKPFCFINTSSLIPRKNHEGLIQAFFSAFGNDPNVHLLINYRYQAGETLQKVTQLIDSLGATNITLQSKPLNNQEYLEFLKEGDVFVSLSKGEGFSIQPREAMALGMPVIISDNTAHKTIIQSGLACAISCPRTELSVNPFLKMACGESFVPDVNEAVKALIDAYKNYDDHLKKSDQSRAFAAHYSYNHLKPYYAALIKPKKVVLGDKNELTEETLTTNSKELYSKYQRLHNWK